MTVSLAWNLTPPTSSFWSLIEDAIRAWVIAGTGLPQGQVWFADQDIPASEQQARVTIRIGGTVQRGIDETRHDYDAGRPVGQEIEFSARGMRELTVDLQAFAPTLVGPGATARSLLEKAQVAISLPTIRDALNAAGLGVLQEGNVQRIPLARGGMQEDRATLAVLFAVQMQATERTTFIETVVIDQPPDVEPA